MREKDYIKMSAENRVKLVHAVLVKGLEKNLSKKGRVI